MKKLILFTFLLFLFTFCKKKENTIDSPVTNTSNTTGGNSVIPNGLAAPTGGAFCNLETAYRFLQQGSSITKDSMITTVFYNSIPGSPSFSYIPAGTISLNGVSIPFNSTGNYYSYPVGAPTQISGNITWSVSGSGTVTPFTQSYIPIYPQYSGYSSLPDTLFISKGVNIPVNGISQTRNSSVFIYVSAGSQRQSKYLTSTNGTISFSANDLSGFPTNGFGQITITCPNIYEAIHGGVRHGFSCIMEFTKVVIIRP